LASNHVSYLDPVVLGVACPRNLNYMAKRELFKNSFFAWILYDVGAFPVKRNSADLSAIREAMRRLKKGQPMVIFPEGSRRFDNRPDEAEAGVGFLVSKVGVPVIPAFVKGTDKALPQKAKFIRPRKISVRFGEKIYIERRMPYQDIAKKIMISIRHLSC